jgi:hypothetical protein
MQDFVGSASESNVFLDSSREERMAAMQFSQCMELTTSNVAVQCSNNNNTQAIEEERKEPMVVDDPEKEVCLTEPSVIVTKVVNAQSKLQHLI